MAENDNATTNFVTSSRLAPKGPAIVGASESGRSRDASAGETRRKTATQQTTTNNQVVRVLLP
jgi:hypothetical protein